ncbi:MAG: hypothetical protein IJP31_05415 [Lachnospiraceae bacterium]|nr:hypothetical protein [Lachnospiraceae bacterium]
MEKNTHLVNIYLKIHHKQSLSMDDLRYLAKYDPECFEKTCKNVVYNIPEAKPIMEPPIEKPPAFTPSVEVTARKNIEKILENLKRLEINDLPIPNIDGTKIRNLLGSLYMELLFPHNDKSDSFMNVAPPETKSSFDQKA